jgi:cytochrome P450
METLRMYTIGPAVTRNAAQDFVFNGYQVKKGQKMLLASASPHFMEEVFPEPHKFDITRYQEPRNEHKKRGAYYPFGIGTHICLGAGAAEAQMLVVTAALLHYVELDSPDKGKTIKIINDPTPTLGKRFRLRIGERRH